MDLNQLLSQHQLAVMRTDENAGMPLGARFDIVSDYERRIADLRDALGVQQYPTWLRTAPTFVG